MKMAFEWMAALRATTRNYWHVQYACVWWADVNIVDSNNWNVPFVFLTRIQTVRNFAVSVDSYFCFADRLVLMSWIVAVAVAVVVVVAVVDEWQFSSWYCFQNDRLQCCCRHRHQQNEVFILVHSPASCVKSLTTTPVYCLKCNSSLLWLTTTGQRKEKKWDY